MNDHICRACGSPDGTTVLDLGEQPACDYFPPLDEPGPDPAYRLRMWLCRGCGLAQLAGDDIAPEEPRAAEPAALVRQAAEAIEALAGAGLLPAGDTVAEFGSPHGGSWLEPLRRRGLVPVTGTDRADLVLDCFGMMHAADQRAAIAERAARLRPGGTLLLQYHSLGTIARDGQWNALRHGHYAYYSTRALCVLMNAAGLRPRTAWRFDLYGGTVLLAASREGAPDETVMDALAAEDGVDDPNVLRLLGRAAHEHAASMRDWLTARRAAGETVLGYGAASRAVALLAKAGVAPDLLPAVADASPAKQGRRMPGTDIPVVAPGELAARRPDAVLLFLADLLPEVRAAYPHVEGNGGRWVSVEDLHAR